MRPLGIFQREELPVCYTRNIGMPTRQKFVTVNSAISRNSLNQWAFRGDRARSLKFALNMDVSLMYLSNMDRTPKECLEIEWARSYSEDCSKANVLCKGTHKLRRESK